MTTTPAKAFFKKLPAQQHHEVLKSLNNSWKDEVDEEDLDTIGHEYRHFVRGSNGLLCMLLCFYKKSPRGIVTRDVEVAKIFDNELEFLFYKQLYELDCPGAHAFLFN